MSRLGGTEYETEPSGLVAGEDYLEARRLVESAGLRLADAATAETEDEAAAAAAGLGYPVVLKALGLLTSRMQVGSRSACATMRSLRAALRAYGNARGRGYVVERMISGRSPSS